LGNQFSLLAAGASYPASFAVSCDLKASPAGAAAHHHLALKLKDLPELRRGEVTFFHHQLSQPHVITPFVHLCLKAKTFVDLICRKDAAFDQEFSESHVLFFDLKPLVFSCQGFFLSLDELAHLFGGNQTSGDHDCPDGFDGFTLSSGTFLFADAFFELFGADKAQLNGNPPEEDFFFFRHRQPHFLAQL
jgi:hypothetical protein